MRAGLLIVACAALAACEGGGDPVQQALRDASAERPAAAYQGSDQPSAPQLEPGSSAPADDMAVETLIADTQRTVASAERVRDATTDPALRDLADKSIAAHEASIAELEAWRQARS